MNKKLNIFKIIIVLACLLSFVGLLLPYESATKEYKEELQKNPEQINVAGTDITNKDAINISIIENFKLYTSTLDSLKNSELTDTGLGGAVVEGELIFNIVLIVILIVSSVLVLLFAIFNRRVLSIIFSLLLLGSSLLMNGDIVSRGVIPSSRYAIGISYYIYPVVAIVMIVSTIALIVKNKKEKNN